MSSDATSKAASAMYRRLYSLAYKVFGCSRDDAHDIASETLCVMLEREGLDFNFGFTVVKHRVYTAARNKKRRKTGQIPTDEDGNQIDLKVRAIEADAFTALIASECVEAIMALPAVTRDVMRLVALGFEPDEIVSELMIPKTEVYWRTQLGRKILRSRDGYELTVKRGHRSFVGIKKDRHRWVASIRKGEDYYHLGQFGTAAEAARAYDAKAKELYGSSAKLNFPQKESVS